MKFLPQIHHGYFFLNVLSVLHPTFWNIISSCWSRGNILLRNPFIVRLRRDTADSVLFYVQTGHTAGRLSSATIRPLRARGIYWWPIMMQRRIIGGWSGSHARVAWQWISPVALATDSTCHRGRMAHSREIVEPLAYLLLKSVTTCWKMRRSIAMITMAMSLVL